MIKITQWTREASASRTIKEYETERGHNADVFYVQIRHSNGQWRAFWGMETNETRDGYTSRLSYPFADYNGQTIIKTGRFNAKTLEKMDAVLAANLDKYYEQWQAGEYRALCNEIHADTAAI